MLSRMRPGALIALNRAARGFTVTRSSNAYITNGTKLDFKFSVEVGLCPTIKQWLSTMIDVTKKDEHSNSVCLLPGYMKDSSEATQPRQYKLSNFCTCHLLVLHMQVAIEAMSHYFLVQV